MKYIKSKHLESRGSTYTIYDNRDSELSSVSFVQDKISKSYRGVVRGFHGDSRTWKLITCLDGIILLITYDVLTDTKNRYILDGDSEQSVSVLVPPSTLNAHQCLTEDCIFHYKWSEYYTGPEDQWSVNYNDKEINPKWKAPVTIVSDRDARAGTLQELRERINEKP
jgi:dTDP-4-dehydrorhamnose 3,5-epimerase